METDTRPTTPTWRTQQRRQPWRDDAMPVTTGPGAAAVAPLGVAAHATPAQIPDHTPAPAGDALERPLDPARSASNGPGHARSGPHALVVGGSIAGLLAARVLADHFARVTVVERDRFPDGPAFRAGVPQSRHVHGLLGRGRALRSEGRRVGIEWR